MRAVLEDVKEDLGNQGSSEAATVGDLLDSLILDRNQDCWKVSLNELILWARYAKKKVQKALKKT